MPTRLDVLVQQRLKKLEAIRALGIDPYPHRYRPSHTAQQVLALLQPEAPAPAEVKVAGRVMANRSMGKAAFMDLHDSSGKVQVYLRRDHVNETQWELYKLLDIGDFIGVSGRPFRTHSGEPTVDRRREALPPAVSRPCFQ